MPKIKVNVPIYRNELLWVIPGEYDLIREFDKDRLLIRLSEKSLTLVYKVTTDYEG